MSDKRCGVCGLEFVVKARKIRHESKCKPCDECGKTYTRLDRQRRHALACRRENR